ARRIAVPALIAAAVGATKRAVVGGEVVLATGVLHGDRVAGLDGDGRRAERHARSGDGDVRRRRGGGEQEAPSAKNEDAVRCHDEPSARPYSTAPRPAPDLRQGIAVTNCSGCSST